ncbi:MAG: metallophosphoesterase [Acidobacteriia bacterium]|nr:metallophosphoesterase [Terriglobia bacterium]
MLSHTRRKFLLAGAAAAGALALGAEGLLVEPNHPKLVRVEIPFPRLPAAFDGFTIAQLSDFHYDEYLGVVPIRAAIEIVNRVQPDVVVLTGDFVTVSFFADYLHNQKESAMMAGPCAALLEHLRSRFGSLAVLGNHDVDASAGLVTEALMSHGITVLRNRAHAIEQSGARLWFCGLDSMWGKPRIDLALREVAKDEPVILLVHEPDFADRAAKHRVDLQLSGHSHGGQVWLPGIGAPWLPSYARKYPRGQYAVGPLTLYTNIGLGTIRVPMRLNCTPEVTLFTLRAGKANRSGS